MNRAHAALVLLAISNAARAQECEPSWSDQFPVADVGWTSRTMFVADDGEGPVLWVVGTTASHAGPVPIKGGARWDGHAWSGIGDPPFTFDVDSAARYDPDADGPLPPRLYVAGWDLYTWDGMDWKTIDTYNGVISLWSMRVFDDDGPGPLLPALHAGHFRFDGDEQQVFGSNSYVKEVYDPDGDGPQPPALYFGGNFAHIGGVPAAGVARWTGSVFEEVGGGVQGGSVAMLKSVDLDGDGPGDPVLLAAGDFDSAGGVPIASLAVWDNAQWSALGGELGHQVDIYGAGVLTPPGEDAPVLFAGASRYILRLDGQEWTPIATVKSPYNYPARADHVLELDPDGDGPAGTELIFQGPFHTLDGYGFYGLARFDGKTFRHLLPGNSPMGTVTVMRPFDEDGPGPGVPRLIVGGDFRSAAGVPADRIARWNGHEWSAVGSGLGGDEDDTYVGSLAEFDEDGDGPKAPVLFVGGDFETAGGQPASNIARWDGKAWSPVAGGMDNDVRALAAYTPEDGEPSLYVGGIFKAVDGQPIEYIARWDGSAWHPAPPLPNGVSALYVHTGDGPAPPGLYAGSGSYVYRLDGQSWTRVGQGLGGGGGNAPVQCLITYDPDGPGGAPADLIVGGSFDIGSVTEWTNIARFDGAEWLPLGGGTGGMGPICFVASMAVVDDDGDGPNPPSLFAGGSFTYAGDVDTLHIARWDGEEWHDMDQGVDGRVVRSVAAFDEDRNGPALPVVYVGGNFEVVGGVSSGNIARWGCPPPPECYADCDFSQGLDLFDFLCFVNHFNAGDPEADCDGSGEFTLFDFLCFVNAFNAGC
jgi:hypothetical protein